MKPNARAILLTLGIFFVLVVLNFLFFVDTQKARENEYEGGSLVVSHVPLRHARVLHLARRKRLRSHATGKAGLSDVTDRDHIGTLVVISPPGAIRVLTKQTSSISANGLKRANCLIVINRDIQISVASEDQCAHLRLLWSAERPDVHLLQPTLLTRNVERVKITEYATRVKFKQPVGGLSHRRRAGRDTGRHESQRRPRRDADRALHRRQQRHPGG